MDRKKFPRNVCFENSDEDLDSPELNFDFEYTAVEPVDGVLIDVEDEQVKLLFYYKKPGNDTDCRAIVEFRVSQRKFLEIVDEFGKRATGLRSHQENIADRMFV